MYKPLLCMLPVVRGITLIIFFDYCRFEDGTVSFLDIIALRHGFDVLERLGGNIINY